MIQFTNEKTKPVRRLMTKGDLCEIFGFVSKSSGEKYYGQLRKMILTDEVLEQIGIDPERYEEITGRMTFNYLETKKIVDFFKIDPAEWLYC